jgi:hypothetical protein
VRAEGSAVQQNGPATAPKENPNKHQTGNLDAGKTIFRMETFGNEGFWTDALRLPAGMMAKKFTPIQALKAGLNVYVDALDDATSFSNPKYFPIGMFDDGPDGNGAPMHITPMFRADLSAPWGSGGEIARLDNFSNLVYTVLFDLTDLTTPGGRAFLHKLGGAAGDEIADEYVKVLAATGVKGYPFVKTATKGTPGTEEALIGVRVDSTKLLDLNAYMNSLPVPAGAKVDNDAAKRGEAMFRTSCTSCHNADQSKFVPPMIVPMKKIFPGDNPVTLAKREPPLNPIENTVASTFDDKMAVINASLRGLERGVAMPLLLDLARKPVFMHDDSVPDLDTLLNPTRGATSPHPFLLNTAAQRNDMVAFLKSLSAR